MSAFGHIGHFLAKDEGSLIACLVQQAGLNRETADWLLAFGAIYLDRQRVHSDRPLVPGQYIRVHFDPKRYPVHGIDWPTTVTYRHDEFIVVNKPPEIPVHPTVDNYAENSVHQLGIAYGERLYVTQRLDVRVGGLIVFGRTREFQSHFNSLLIKRRVKKSYRALVQTQPSAGRYVHFMAPSERSPKTLSTMPFPDSLECALSVRGVKEMGSLFDVEIDLETGRTHQIRAQLSAIGSPILGDALYGSVHPFEVDGNLFRGIALFSASISWMEADREWSFTQNPPWVG